MRRFGSRLSLALILAAVAGAAAWTGSAAGQTTQPAPPKCENGSCQDPLFTVDYPARDTFVTSHGVEVHVPVQFYDSRMVFLLGQADLAVLRKLTAGSGFYPLRTDSGRGIAAIDVNEWDDTNIEPYLEGVIDIPVSPDRNAAPVPVSQNPYELVGASVALANKVYTLKLVLNRQLPIDVGREFYKLDKEPTPQVMTTDITASRARFSVAEPNGQPVVSADVPIDASPAAQFDALQRLGSTQGFREWLADSALHSGVNEFNYVYRDVTDPAVIRHAHAAGHVSMDLTGTSFGTLGPDAKFDVHAGTAYGTLLQQMRFEPQVVNVFQRGRWVLADGWEPATEPSQGSLTGTADLGHGS